jgi:hypothetical protein
MNDDINLSTAIISDRQMKVEFNTNTQSTRLNRRRIGCFIEQVPRV